ncbi:hypothetical protein [Antarctobacter heliothermus]|uniref:hypothetical protein n=1 Tax=Antarctobacter heliothermus TaxID=74033 RepID=UPI0031841FE8
MKDRASTRILIVGCFLAAVAVLGWVVWATSHAEALRQVHARGQSDLALAADRLMTGLQRYRSLAVTLVEHPVLSALHRGGSRVEAEALLLRNADRTGALTALYADREGRVLAAAHGEAPADLMAQPWFLRAANGALGAETTGSAHVLAGGPMSTPRRISGPMAGFRGCLFWRWTSRPWNGNGADHARLCSSPMTSTRFLSPTGRNCCPGNARPRR